MIVKNLFKTNNLAKISFSYLISLGRDLKYTRLCIILILQKHCLQTKQTDHFQDFDYNLLMQAEDNQTLDLLQPRIKKLVSLPIEVLKEFGLIDKKIAKKILLDTKSHIDSLELMAIFAENYSSLRVDILNYFANLLANIPLNEQYQARLFTTISKLAQNHPEFAKLAQIERFKRFYPEHNNASIKDYAKFFKAVYGASSGAVSAVYLTEILTILLSVHDVAALAVTGSMSAASVGSIAASATAAASGLILPMAAIASVGYVGHCIFSDTKNQPKAEIRP